MKGNTLRAARLTVGGKDFVHICIFMEFGFFFFFFEYFYEFEKRRIGDKLFSVSFLTSFRLFLKCSLIIVNSQTVFINAQSLKVFRVFHPSAHLRDIPEAFKHTHTQHWFIHWAFVLFDHSFIDWLLAEALLMALRLSWSGPKRAHSSAVRGHQGESRLAQNADAPNSFELSEFWAGGIPKALLLYFAHSDSEVHHISSWIQQRWASARVTVTLPYS